MSVPPPKPAAPVVSSALVDPPRWRCIVGPKPQHIHDHADLYFNRTAAIVKHYGDCQVRYAVFLRRPVRCVLQPVLAWLDTIGSTATVHRRYEEGVMVGAGDPLLLLDGSLGDMVAHETALLQLIGAPSVVAANAALMCAALPNVAFVAMEARHCTDPNMNALTTYAAAVGGAAARKEQGAKGFVGTSIPALAWIFGEKAPAIGTMPHVLVGYAGSTVRAAEMFAARFPKQTLTVLIDYFGQEITDALAVCQRFPDHAHEGRLQLRIDTTGSRYVEGLDPASSYAVLERHAPSAIRQYLSASESAHLIGPGVSAAAVWWLRERLDQAGFTRVPIVASSGFDAEKCRVFASAAAPVDTIGTGNFLPARWSETYATADVVSFDGVPRVKVGREYLLSLGPR